MIYLQHAENLLHIEPTQRLAENLEILLTSQDLHQIWYYLKRNPRVVHEPFPDRYSYFPLHHAAEQEHAKNLIFLLLQAQADVHARDYEDETPLHVATLYAGVADIAWLLNFRSDVNSRSLRNVMPLHHAANRGQPSIVSLILQAKAVDVDAQRYYADPLYDGAVPLLLATLILVTEADSIASEADCVSTTKGKLKRREQN